MQQLNSMFEYLKDLQRWEKTEEWAKSRNRAKYEIAMIPFLRLPAAVFSTLLLIETYVMIPPGLPLIFIQLGLGAIFIASVWSIALGLFTHYEQKKNVHRLEKELGWQ